MGEWVEERSLEGWRRQLVRGGLQSVAVLGAAPLGFGIGSSITADEES